MARLLRARGGRFLRQRPLTARRTAVPPNPGTGDQRDGTQQGQRKRVKNTITKQKRSVAECDESAKKRADEGHRHVHQRRAPVLPRCDGANDNSNDKKIYG